MAAPVVSKYKGFDMRNACSLRSPKPRPLILCTMSPTICSSSSTKGQRGLISKKILAPKIASNFLSFLTVLQSQEETVDISVAINVPWSSKSYTKTIASLVWSATYLFWKMIFVKNHFESFPDCENVFCLWHAVGWSWTRIIGHLSIGRKTLQTYSQIWIFMIYRFPVSLLAYSSFGGFRGAMKI